ncbi:MAG: hypothetical protein IPO66_17955 [Rhodanobacteraceae bacterium]|nr:hypothetical protein [Rhodanobacteraceae bacterium]
MVTRAARSCPASAPDGLGFAVALVPASMAVCTASSSPRQAPTRSVRMKSMISVMLRAAGSRLAASVSERFGTSVWTWATRPGACPGSNCRRSPESSPCRTRARTCSLLTLASSFQTSQTASPSA